MPHHFKLEQNKADELGIYFGNGGGNLDLKGNSLTLNTISSNDSRANIINTDTDGNNPSYITIEGLGLMILRKRQIKKRIPLSTQVLGKAQILKVLIPIKITI